MTVTALPGIQRLRALQIGPESAINTPVAATRRLPWRWTNNPNPNWTNPDIDTGTLSRAVPPHRLAPSWKGQSTGDLAFDDIPNIMTALLKPVTPSPAGTAITWTAQPAETSQDNFQTNTVEFSDDVDGDAFQYASGVLEKAVIAFPETLAPASVTADWVFTNLVYPHTKTPGLTVDVAPVWVYAADTGLYINSTAGTIGNTQLLNTMHGSTITISQATDVKYFMNGSNTRFIAQGFARGLRMVEVSFNFAKSAAALTEAANWLNANAVDRYLSIKTVSPVLIPSSAVPYSNEFRLHGYWYTRSETNYATGNTGIGLVCQTTVDPTLTYALWWQAVCARAAL